MLAKLALAIARGMAPSTIAGLTDIVFTRTRRDLERACADPRAAQEKRLRAILSANASTEIGRKHDFAGILSAAGGVLEAYRAKVPLCTWDDVEPYVTRMLAGERDLIVSEDPYFYATTSGTTGRRKLIPVTSQFVDECRVGNKVLYKTTLSCIPQLLKGKRLGMRSPKTEKLNDKGALAGSITVALGGFEDDEGLLDAVPVDVFLIDDFDAKYFLALRFALEQDIRVCSAVNPSTLLLFARFLAERGDELALALENGVAGVDLAAVIDDEARRDRIASRLGRDEEAAERIRKSMAENGGKARMRDVFPRLAGLVCWKGGSAPWYVEKLAHSYGDLPILDYGYVASEGCFGAPLSTEGAASVLLPHGHVIELLPVDGGGKSTLLLHEAEVGKKYLVVVTTGAGLYRYQMNDVVEIRGKLGQAPLAVFLHKGGAMSSVTGEKISESHVVDAMAAAHRALAASSPAVAGFVAAPILPEGDDATPRYLLAVDAAGVDDADLAALARAFDHALRAANEEYEAKRASLRLESALAVLLPKDAVARFRERRVKAGAPDAHVKVPHVSADGALLLDLGLDETAPQWAARLPCRVGRAQ